MFNKKKQFVFLLYYFFSFKMSAKKQGGITSNKLKKLLIGNHVHTEAGATQMLNELLGEANGRINQSITFISITNSPGFNDPEKFKRLMQFVIARNNQGNENPVTSLIFGGMDGWGEKTIEDHLAGPFRRGETGLTTVKIIDQYQNPVSNTELQKMLYPGEKKRKKRLKKALPSPPLSISSSSPSPPGSPPDSPSLPTSSISKEDQDILKKAQRGKGPVIPTLTPPPSFVPPVLSKDKKTLFERLKPKRKKEPVVPPQEESPRTSEDVMDEIKTLQEVIRAHWEEFDSLLKEEKEAREVNSCIICGKKTKKN